MKLDAWDDDGDAGPPTDRWLLSFADLLTLLLAFFVVMYSVSAVNETKLSELATSLSAKFYPNQSPGGVNGAGALDSPTTPSKKALAESLITDLSSNIDVSVDGESNGRGSITILLPGHVLFDVGSSQLSERGQRQLAALLPLLAHTAGPIQVEGHTDDQPISTEKFPSNWELSAHRAAATVRFLEREAVTEADYIVLGLADTQPVGVNTTLAGRSENRRIVIKVSSIDWTSAEQAIKEAKANSLSGNDDGSSPPLINLNNSELQKSEAQEIEEIDPALLEEVLKNF